MQQLYAEAAKWGQSQDYLLSSHFLSSLKNNIKQNNRKILKVEKQQNEAKVKITLSLPIFPLPVTKKNISLSKTNLLNLTVFV